MNNDFDYRSKWNCRSSSAGGSSCKRRAASRNVSFQRGGRQSSGGNRSRDRGFFGQIQPRTGDARRRERLSGLLSHSGVGATGGKRDRSQRRGRSAANRAEFSSWG